MKKEKLRKIIIGQIIKCSDVRKLHFVNEELHLDDFGEGLEKEVLLFIKDFFVENKKNIKPADLLNSYSLKNKFVKHSHELSGFYLNSSIDKSKLKKHYDSLQQSKKLFENEILVEIQLRYGLIKASIIYLEVQDKSIEYFISELKKRIKLDNVFDQYEKLGVKLKVLREKNAKIPDNLLNNLLDSTLKQEEIQKSNENTKDIMNRLLEARKTGSSVIIPTYVENIDKRFLDDGFRNGELIFTGARPSVGKTAFSLNLFYRQIIRSHNVKYVTLESTKEEILQRLLTIHSNYFGNYNEDIRLPDWKDGGFKLENKNSETRKKILCDFIESRFAKHVIDLSEHSSFYRLKSKLTQLATQEDRVELIYVDHAHELVGDGSNLTTFFRNAFVKLRNEISRKYDQALNVIVQLKRPNSKRKDEKPGIDSIKYSGIAEQIGDFVIILDREDYGKSKRQRKSYDDDNLLNVNFGKSRDGKTGICSLKFFKDRMYITDIYKTPDELATVPNYESKMKPKIIQEKLFED